GHPAHAQQVAQREFDADREHEEHYTDLGEELERMRVGHGRAGREAADEHAADEITEEDGLTRDPRHAASHDGGDDHPGEVVEELRVGRHRMGRRYHALGRGYDGTGPQYLGARTARRAILLFWTSQKSLSGRGLWLPRTRFWCCRRGWRTSRSSSS